MNFTRMTAALAVAAALVTGSAAFADESMDTGHDTVMHGIQMGRFGGPVYSGAPALAVTASLVAAGGGADKYSTATALTSMLGAATVKAEVGKLTKQYGAAAVTTWLKTFDFAVNDSLKIATAAGVKLPEPTLSGKELAETLVKAGTASDGTFQIEFLLDKAVSHKIHVQVMNDIDKEPDLGKKADYDYHRISNQAFYDVAQALGLTSVKLAAVH
jgi:hypothetical protein